jgi:hypothetical protein
VVLENLPAAGLAPTALPRSVVPGHSVRLSPVQVRGRRIPRAHSRANAKVISATGRTCLDNFCKQTLNWTTPRVRTPQQADRWTWLVTLAYTQLRLARRTIEDVYLPWEGPQRARRTDDADCHVVATAQHASHLLQAECEIG